MRIRLIMNKQEQKILEKFRKFSFWMCNDIQNAMFLAKANFLVAQGLFNYTEIIGSFMTGQYIKDKSGVPKVNRKGALLETGCRERFEEFFKYMGKEYKILITKKKLAVYDELRCGLTHEYLIKNKRFCVYNPDKLIDEEHMDFVKHPKRKNAFVTCGVIHYRNSWQIINPKYYIDFKRAVNQLIIEVENEGNVQLNNNFFERAQFVNIKNFS